MSSMAWVDKLSPDAQTALFNEINEYLAQSSLADYAPYRKQAEFHAAGAKFRERMLIAANQVGKTLGASREIAMHLTGQYPDWWKGLRFDRPNHWLAGSESGELTRRGVQRLLLGRDIKTAIGNGAIPADRIVGVTMARGVAEMADTVPGRWGDNGTSTVSLKSYDQGRAKWQADTVDGVWFDEEPPEDVYIEGLTRTNTTLGPVLTTLTPVNGMSTVVKRFMIDKMPGTWHITMTIDDAEHYTPAQRAAIIASYPLHEREARARGVPSMGSGLIFPVEESLITVPAFGIPAHVPRINGLDFGWDHPTAATSNAWDRDADVWYVTQAYRRSEASPILHAAAIKPWGAWIPVAWPHDGNNDLAAGPALAGQYKAQGLKMLPEHATHEDGSNSVEAGLMDMLDRMQTGRFKVFAHLADFFEEYRMYHRKDGKVVKLMDDLICSIRR